jgi:MFS transporter, DHA2 family, methylenomycin A resistance protein
MNTILRTNALGGLNRTTPKVRDLTHPDRPPHSVAWTIAACSFAFAVIQLDVTIVNVALSRISEDLGATVTELQWVVDAYTIGFAALLLSAGVISDRLGSKSVFIAGLIGFAAASLSCGLAPGPGFLNVTRAVQGVGAALGDSD